VQPALGFRGQGTREADCRVPVLSRHFFEEETLAC
jgi:hypothetical protein